MRLFALNMIGFSSIIFISQYFFLTKQHLLIKLFEEKNQWIKEAFEAYISPRIVDHLLQNPGQLKLSGERRECSFVFTDLVGFTGLVEQSDPEKIMMALNEYLEGMTKIIFKHEGTIQKIVGDAIAVMFSAPVIQEDHALRAVQCAMEMKIFGEKFTELKVAQGFSFGLTRIGVHTGEVIVGNFGSVKQFDYRAFGDAINTTARLEGVNKHLGTTICVSAATVEKCPGFYGRRVGSLILKGKTKPVMTYEPLILSQTKSLRIRLYRKAFGLIEQSVTEAMLVFERLLIGYPNDALAAFHLNRLRSGENGTIIKMQRK